MIKVPVKLEKSKVEQIKQSYVDAIREVGLDEQTYVFSRIEKVAEMLIKSNTAWKSVLGEYALSLHKMYKEYFKLYDHDCTGWHDLDDIRCLDCGEEDDTMTRYEYCKKRQTNLNQFGNFKIRDVSVLRCSILAALFYLCNIYDIIPDYTPGIGYVDDAYVLNWSLNLIKRKNSRLFEKHLGF